MSFLQRLRKLDGSVDAIIDALLPGTSRSMQTLRRDCLALVGDPLARGTLILGPAGAGKSALARSIALCRYLHVLERDRVVEVLQTLRSDGPYRIALQSVPWLEEFSLPGLAESVAEAQLFGYTAAVSHTPHPGKVKRTAVMGRPSIFEIAARGHVPPGERVIPQGAIATNGVVFLDEIGDLSPALQPKLLAVVTGARVYRIGGEGDEEYGFEFRGLTIAATWKDVGPTIRPDLLSRLSDHVLRVPSLTDRADQLDTLCEAILEEVKSQHQKWTETISPRPPEGSVLGAGRSTELEVREPVANLDRTRLAVQQKAVTQYKLSTSTLARLRDIDWSTHGELRGLTQVIRRVVYGASVEDALETVQQHPTPDRNTPRALAEALCDSVLANTEPVGSLTEAINSVEKRVRAEIILMLEADTALRQAFQNKLGLAGREWTVQRAELKRRLSK